MEPFRVLYLIDRLGRGGAAEVVVSSALTINRSRYSPIVCVTRRTKSNEHERLLQKGGVPLIQLKRRSSFHLLSWKKLWKTLPAIDILHSHESGSNFWGRIFGWFFRVPFIISQEHTASNEKKPIVRLCDRFLGSISNRIVAVSEYDRRLLIRMEKLSPEKVVTIYNGIDTHKFDNKVEKNVAREQAKLPRDKYILAVIARLVHQKNHVAFFAALNLLPSDVKSAIHCIVVGGGDLETQLPREAKRQGVHEIISFLGEREDIPTLLRAIDLLVLPSHWECLPMIILEALAAGCPLVATTVGGIPEVLETVGWPLVQPNHHQALADSIESIFRMSSVDRARIAEKGKRHVARAFSKDVSMRQVETLYDSLTESVSTINGCHRKLNFMRNEKVE